MSEFVPYPVESPEVSPGRLTPERLASDKKKDSKERKDKKKQPAATAGALGEVITIQAVEEERRENRVRETLWQRLSGDADVRRADKTADEQPLFGIIRPDVPVENPGNHATDVKAETTVDSDAQADASETAETEILTAEQTAELYRAGQDYAEIRLQAADGELHEMPLRSHDTPEAAEAAVSIALMREVSEGLSRPGDTTAAEVVAVAAQAVSSSIEQPISQAPDQEQLLAAVEASETGVAPETAETAPEAAADTAANDAPAEALPESVEQPLTPDTAETTPFDMAPPPPEPPPLPAFGGYGGSIPRPTYDQAPVPSNPNVLPVAKPVSSERPVVVNGVLAGGIVGYFIGRRRGRKQGKLNAERQLSPVRKTLEKQVKNLQDTIAAKEQQLRRGAHEKVAAITKPQERRKVIERLLTPQPKPTIAGERTGQPRPVERPQTAETAVRPTSAVETAKRPAEFEPSVTVGRLLVEAPMAAIAAPIIAERKRAEAKAERAGLIPFDKKVEQYSQQELLVASEKITVQGVTLREMTELGRLDEPGLRRVVGEFLQGGDVTAAVSREVKAKELTFERDPRLRRAATASTETDPAAARSSIAGATHGWGSAGANAPAAQASPERSGEPTLAQNNQPATVGSAHAATPGAKNDDQAAQKARRDKQLASVTTTTAVIALLLVIFLLITL